MVGGSTVVHRANESMNGANTAPERRAVKLEAPQ